MPLPFMRPSTAPVPPQPSVSAALRPAAVGPGLGLRSVLTAVAFVLASAGISTWLVLREACADAERRLLAQEADGAEMVAGLLAGRIDQGQKVLRAVAAGIIPAMSAPGGAAAPQLLHGVPVPVDYFESLHVVGAGGDVPLNLLRGRAQQASALSPLEREYLLRALIERKPAVSGPIAGGGGAPRVMFTMPMLHGDGRFLGVVGGSLRLQSQDLLPASMGLPGHVQSRLVVFARDGTILSHPDPSRLLGRAADEPGLADAYAAWAAEDRPVVADGRAQLLPQAVVALAGMPLPQWMVARITPRPQVLGPLEALRQRAWAVTAAAAGSCAVLAGLLVAGWMRPIGALRRRMQQLHGEGGDGGALPPHADWPHAGGEAGALVAAVRDLAVAHDRDRQALAVLADQLMAILHNAPVGILHNAPVGILHNAPVGILVSRRGRLEMAGRHACQLFGYTAAELQGWPARMLYPSDDAFAELREKVREDFAVHGFFDGEVLLLRKDGSPFWVHLVGHEVESAGGGDGRRIWILEDITAQRDARQRLSWTATHDALTQLVNRREFEQRLLHCLAPHGVGAGGEAAVLYVDLDRFKDVNDHAGHAAGDDVLCHLARLMESQVRGSDTVARMGGDEFAILLAGCTVARAAVIAESLRAAIAGWQPQYLGRVFALGVSVGVTAIDTGMTTPADVLHAAGMACHAAKRAGRNQVVVHQAVPLRSMA
ncbi:diguanylate cyclase [Xylophilus sp.]|uniref:diguanylate cyclase n=1 Tax=Xylophilus sp. TaxID=2653893 RepID=UPI0013BC963E|nr:diguanylate cyclase [Xylophilus sp.]KAF1046014.1 MAG: putative diguanylate cyclase DgcE [Xylophilus sp.]